jgi:hypothetical protein
MSHTLRRSCAACAKSKLGCDLRLPRCSRCEKRNAVCVYANEPLTGPPAASKWHHDRTTPSPEGSLSTLTHYRPGTLDMDPFDSYPQTRLPREHVQRLIHGCTCTIDRGMFRSLTKQYSPAQNRIPILSARSQRDVEPFSSIMVVSWSSISNGPYASSSFAY